MLVCTEGGVFINLPDISTLLAFCLAGSLVPFKIEACISCFSGLIACSLIADFALSFTLSALTTCPFALTKLIPINTLAKPTLNLRKL